MKSNIDSEQVKKLVFEAVEKALIECSQQHQYSIDEPGDPMKKTDYYNQYKIQPSQLSMTLMFKFDRLHKGKPGQMFCQPIIDLTGIKDEE